MGPLGLITLAFAWVVLILAIKESYGIWRLFLGATLALSMVSYFMGLRLIFYATLVISVFCIPYLVYQGYGIFKR